MLKKSYQNGENIEKVINTGCPSMDIAREVLENPQLDFDPFQKYSGVGETFDLNNGYLVVMQHPVTTEFARSERHICETLEAIDELNIPTFGFGQMLTQEVMERQVELENIEKRSIHQIFIFLKIWNQRIF